MADPVPRPAPAIRRAGVSAERGGMRFYYLPGIQLATIVLFALGGGWLWAGVALTFGLTALLDEALGEGPSGDRGPGGADAPLFLSCLLVLVLIGQGLVMARHGLAGNDPASTGQVAFGGLMEPQPVWALAGACLCLGMQIAAVAGNVGHEFSHRLDSPARLGLGQWLLALAFHTSLPIEHVHGHHRNVGLRIDPATARRGEGFWRFAVRSVTGTYRNAYRLEAERCRRRGRPVLSPGNRAVAGYLKQVVVLAAVAAAGGLAGLLAFCIAAITALLIIELFSYVGHYGLVRAPGTPIRADHAWSWSRIASSSFMFNLTRHGEHHLAGARPYWQLRHGKGPACYPFGPFVMVLAAMVPPVFMRLAAKPLARWDAHCATADERRLAAGGDGRPGDRA